MIKKNNIFPALMIGVMIVLILPNIINLIKGPAPTPDVFSNSYTMEQASQISQETGKPMFVLATLNSCPPCQKLKRTTMMDPEVIAWINDNMIPVYLEYSANPDELSNLPVRSFPTTLLVKDNTVLSSVQGAVRSADLMSSFNAKLTITP
tara:strand:+ start:63523 stop:63972 length:450 start_codon:yes stop_codon:yes gene_type:complete